jgi:hypothetical protein
VVKHDSFEIALTTTLTRAQIEALAAQCADVLRRESGQKTSGTNADGSVVNPSRETRTNLTPAQGPEEAGTREGPRRDTAATGASSGDSAGTNSAPNASYDYYDEIGALMEQHPPGLGFQKRAAPTPSVAKWVGSACETCGWVITNCECKVKPSRAVPSSSADHERIAQQNRDLEFRVRQQRKELARLNERVAGRRSPVDSMQAFLAWVMPDLERWDRRFAAVCFRAGWQAARRALSMPDDKAADGSGKGGGT